MEQTRFTTFDECLDYVSLSLGIYANDHDVIAIAREAFTFDEQKQSFVLVVSESEYWELVDKLDELKAAIKEKLGNGLDIVIGWQQGDDAAHTVPRVMTPNHCL